jgi:hypothetical protein
MNFHSFFQLWGAGGEDGMVNSAGYSARGRIFSVATLNGKEAAKVASERLAKDNRFYQHIKTGMREYNFRDRDQHFWKAKNGQMLFETAHLSAFHVDHFCESRVGFYFKDLDEYGLWCGFAGEGDVYIESYYRTDRTFQEEGQLLHDDD